MLIKKRKIKGGIIIKGIKSSRKKISWINKEKKIRINSIWIIWSNSNFIKFSIQIKEREIKGIGIIIKNKF